MSDENGRDSFCYAIKMPTAEVAIVEVAITSTPWTPGDPLAKYIAPDLFLTLPMHLDIGPFRCRGREWK